MNKILTDHYREHYAEDIAYLKTICPEMMSRKIEEANVQQAFTFSQTKKYAQTDSKILCVGSFEDTAYESLKKLGYDIVGIDPAIDMDLDGYFQNVGNKVDLIFSTSVIEHVKDDDLFIDQMCSLLNPGGYGILTCDFRDDYKPGDPMPGEDQRLYTKKDLLKRFPALLAEHNCSMVGDIDYDHEPDFTYGVYKYSFATFTFKKND